MGLEHTNRSAAPQEPTPGNPDLNPPQVQEGDKQSRGLAPILWVVPGIGFLCVVVLAVHWTTIFPTPAPVRTGTDAKQKSRVIRFDGQSWNWAGVYPGGIDYCFFEGDVYTCESPGIRLLVLRPTPERGNFYERIHAIQRKTPHGGWLNDGIHESWLREGPSRHEISHFKMGKLHGEFKAWDETGRLVSRQQYYNDMEHGLHESWYSNGQKEYEVVYQSGVEISGKVWNPDGSPFSFVRD